MPCTTGSLVRTGGRGWIIVQAFMEDLLNCMS